MGDAINMAARLMCHKEAKRGILCDEKTYNLCESEYQFENLGETTVKGKSSPISIFRPVFLIPEGEKNTQENQALLSSGVIGREAEKKALSIAIEQLSNASIVDNLFFSAEGGQGLTTLANHAKAEALKQACHFWYLILIQYRKRCSNRTK
jgi:Flp pilus assembly CpaF family ATPase